MLHIPKTHLKPHGQVAFCLGIMLHAVQDQCFCVHKKEMENHFAWESYVGMSVARIHGCIFKNQSIDLPSSLLSLSSGLLSLSAS